MKRALLCFLALGGCGTAFVEGVDTSAFSTDAGEKKDDAADSAPADDDGGLGCTAQTCDDLKWKCGSGDNGCQRTVTCKPCDAPSKCTSEHTCKCEPATCQSFAAECGQFPDGCGGTDLNCGSCSNGNQCNNGKCQAKLCTPITSCGKGQCGAISDGCSGTIDCGNCQAPESCGGSGTTNQCGCTRKTKEDACGARQCGSVADECGGAPIVCGSCATGKGCDTAGTCTAAACVATKTCTTERFGCGVFADDCGRVQECGEKPKYQATAAICTTTMVTGGYLFPHICDCVEKKTCTSASYAGVPPTWNCIAGVSNGQTLNGRFCCKETH